jgi:hypothetical protein
MRKNLIFFLKIKSKIIKQKLLTKFNEFDTHFKEFNKSEPQRNLVTETLRA